MTSKDTTTPFQAKINGNSCIILVGDGSLDIQFRELQGSSLRIKYSAIRCIQLWGGTVLLNVSKDGTMVSYAVTAPAVKKLHALIMARLAGR